MNNNYSRNPNVTPYGHGHMLCELMMMLKEGLEQRPKEKLPNRGRLESQRKQQRKKQMLYRQVLP